MANDSTQVAGDEWVSFPGGELEGKRPNACCPACREALTASARTRTATTGGAAAGAGLPSPRLLCFQCYRAELDRERALRDAGQLNTASDARFQSQLPFEPVDESRLAMLKVERAETRAADVIGAGRFADKRRQAQIAARHALQAIAAGLQVRHLSPSESVERHRAMAFAIHAAELQLPESWLPFVVAR